VPSLHLAVAPVGSVLPAVAVGADLVAVDDFAAVAAGVAGAGVAAAAGAAAAGAGAVVAAVAGLALVGFWMPPWPLQVPLPVEVVVVPSLQVVVAPLAAGAAAGAAAGVVVLAFCTPPWPLQVPLPVDVVVVPSLQVVGAGSAARLGIAKANINKGTAIRLATVIFFMNVNSLVWFGQADCKPIFSECDRGSLRAPDRQYAIHLNDKTRVLALCHTFQDLAIDNDVRILADAVRKFRHPNELHIVRR